MAEVKEKKPWVVPENSLNIKNLYVYQADASNWVVTAKDSAKKTYHGTLAQAVAELASQLTSTAFAPDLREILMNQKKLIEEIHSIAQTHFKEEVPIEVATLKIEKCIAKVEPVTADKPRRGRPPGTTNVSKTEDIRKMMTPKPKRTRKPKET